MSEVISVVICTHNRAGYLSAAINSLLAQSISRTLYEILVVDNCSTDSTREVVRKFSVDHNVKYLHEPNLGLSHARNTGWRNARGKYAAYLDDDAVAGTVWLEKALEAFERVMPMPGCVGGKVTPIWEALRPRWISNELVTGLTAVDWSDEPHQIDDLGRQWLVGANIAFPVEVLKRVGGFVPCLDRVGSRLLSGGDVFLQKQIQKAGYKCFYYPDMAVQHVVPRTRLTQRWFIARYFWQGVSDAVMQLIEERPSMVERLRLAMPLILDLLGTRKGLAALFLPSRDPGRFTKECFALITLGHILGLLGLAKAVE